MRNKSKSLFPFTTTGGRRGKHPDVKPLLLTGGENEERASEEPVGAVSFALFADFNSFLLLSPAYTLFCDTSRLYFYFEHAHKN